MNFWLVLFFFFITHDFYIYWFHRLQHNHRWLWRTHEAHHSVREVDFLAGSRSHFLEILINQTVEFLPIFFLLNAETAAYIFPLKGLIDALWGMWIHSNINVNSGKLQYIINGPEMHQWHHANHHEVFYKNYGTKLAIWDWMFGTGFLPNLKPLNFYFSKPKTFGLPYAYPSGFFGQTVYALWRYDFRALESNPIYNFILNFRKNISSTILELFKIKSNWTREEIFAENNPRYLIDIQNKLCPKCGQLEKYYELANDFIYTCEHCETHDELNKFN